MGLASLGFLPFGGLSLKGVPVVGQACGTEDSSRFFLVCALTREVKATVDGMQRCEG